MTDVSAAASRWKRFRWLGLALVVPSLLAAAVWLSAPWYVYAKALPARLSAFGLTMTADRRDLSARGAEFHGVRFLDGDEVVLTAKRMNVRISLHALYGGRTIVERLVFDDPELRARITGDGHTNVGAILARPKTDPRRAARPATLWKEIVVRRGTVDCDDRPRGVHLRLVNVDSRALDVQTGRGESQNRFGQITIDAQLEQPHRKPAPLSIVHWTTTAVTAKPSFTALAALTGIDLDAFPAYVDDAYRASYGVDHLDLVVSMDVRDGTIRRGAAVATSPERERPLTLVFGGPFDDPVLDRSGQLTALWELPFARLGRLGDVAWDTGSAVSDTAVAVVAELAKGDPFAASSAAVAGVDEGVSAIGEHARGAVEALGRAIGLVEPEKPRDVRAVHARQRELFLAARREAARSARRWP